MWNFLAFWPFMQHDNSYQSINIYIQKLSTIPATITSHSKLSAHITTKCILQVTWTWHSAWNLSLSIGLVFDEAIHTYTTFIENGSEKMLNTGAVFLMPSRQIIQLPALLVHLYCQATITRSLCLTLHGQSMSAANTIRWTTWIRALSQPNTVFEWPICYSQLQVYLWRWHLPSCSALWQLTLPASPNSDRITPPMPWQESSTWLALFTLWPQRSLQTTSKESLNSYILVSH